MVNEDMTQQVATMIQSDVTHGYWYAYGRTPLNGMDFWTPEELCSDGELVMGKTANFHDMVSLPVSTYLSMRKRPLVQVGLWGFTPPGPDTPDIQYANRHPSSAGRALYRARQEHGELRARLDDLQRRLADMRETVLHDPDHDNDTINWALGIIDDALTTEPGTTPAAAKDTDARTVGRTN